MELLAGAVSWVSDGLSRLAGAVAGAPAAPPGRVPVRIVYATTGGTARRYADVLHKELFAMGMSGFWFELQLVDAGELTMDGVDALLEAKTNGATVFLLPTWTGGVPPDSGRLLADAVNDQATDFRVSKDALAHLRYAVFALGSSAYAHAGNWARAGRELDANLRALSAVPLAELGVGDESSDMEAAFREWREGALYPALCELYAQAHGGGADGDDEGEGEDVEGAADGDASGAAAACCGGGSGSARAGGDAACCGGSASSGCGCKEGAAGAAAVPPGGGAYPVNRREWRKLGIGYGEGQKLTLRQWRRQQRAEAEERRQDAEAAARAAARKEKARLEAEAAAAAAAAAVATGADSNANDDDDGLTEEDRVNDRFIAGGGDMDDDDDDKAVAAARRKAAAALGEGVGDVEDLGAAMAAAKADAARAAAAAAAGKPPPEMITPMQRRVLTKEGYQLIGGHSAVKLCRWTKAQLRGRGGCYKHTGYGIASYQCMELTPSLACASKCTFCWRHGRNPVGTSWRWSVDDPAMIVEQGVDKHVAMVKQLKGMPGIKMERYHEAFTVRHCALSLVGEPIFYPRINELLRLLHGRRISSFLVNNGQHPEALAALEPVTQLYISIDAATKETLKAIDRPLFADFWERFLRCLELMRDKGQRTVYRLTLIKGPGGNADALDDYVELILRGQPDLIEVKGVTYCGDSPGSGLTMANVPWHAEVREFCEALAARLAACGRLPPGLTYGLAVEHAHSCFVLLAKETFRIGGAWHTHIDYERFHDLAAAYYATGATFTALDYVARTPDWAVYGAPEAGFDPVEVRWRRKGDGTVAEAEYVPSESGCG